MPFWQTLNVDLQNFKNFSNKLKEFHIFKRIIDVERQFWRQYDNQGEN